MASQIDGQMTIFDLIPIEPDVGEYIPEPGAIICHIMRPAYIGRKVAYNCSTESRRWYRVGILERYIEHEGHMRSIIYDGRKQRVLLTHYPGREIYECLPWDSYHRLEAK